MTEVYLVKSPGGILRPAHDADAEVLARIKTGALLMADIKQPRNPDFHRKLFALLNLGFDYWEPGHFATTGTDGALTVGAEKNFDRFRKDILILAGFRKAVVNIKNEVRYEAESISFAAMDETRFAEVYRAVFGVCWRLVLSRVEGMTEADAENAVNQMLSFD